MAETDTTQKPQSTADTEILQIIGKMWECLYRMEKLNDAIATGVVKSWLIRQEKGIKYGKRF